MWAVLLIGHRKFRESRSRLPGGSRRNEVGSVEMRWTKIFLNVLDIVIRTAYQPGVA
jgi:hypothetical protein